jgi:DNA-binding CsgD family transcriptional regulator
MRAHHQPTNHQLAVLATYARTGSASRTASALGLALPTVKNELSTLYGVMGVRGRFGALSTLGWISPPRDVTSRPRKPPAGSLVRWRSFVLATYVRAGSTDDAAAELGESRALVRSELHDLYHKLGTRGAMEAMRKLGWLTIPRMSSGLARGDPSVPPMPRARGSGRGRELRGDVRGKHVPIVSDPGVAAARAGRANV